MGFDFGKFEEDGLSEAFVEWLVEEEWVAGGAQFGRLWDYYDNPMRQVMQGRNGGDNASESGRNYVQAQEVGLPARITGVVYSRSNGAEGGRSVPDIQRKEVVIENDIAWRINAMVDFLFGKGVQLISKSPQVSKRREIEKIMKAVFSANGGNGFFQDMAVLGSVYGFVDCVVRPGEEVLHHFYPTKWGGSSNHTIDSRHTSSLDSIVQIASRIGLELIEAPRALPVLDENDYRKIRYYVQSFHQQKNDVMREGGFLSRLLGGSDSGTQRRSVMVTEVIGPGWWQRYENKELVSEGENPLGIVPVVHVQNIAQPYFYEGISDVGQLMALQDELNTRLSDRASRITFGAFKMYLVKGIEGVEDKPVSPGRMWCTDNPDATIEEFGGDSSVPSEDRHISEIRDAMDKISGVTPVVAGLLKNKLGNLTSGVALKMTFMGMLARTTRKQFTYGEGLKEICWLVLHALDVCGVYRTKPSEREFEMRFANPLPENMMERLEEARIKKELGVSQEQLLSELGYE
ncbi:MAG TPA: phage portal protein [Phycisphaerales bacterium]|nr:phage portal protein [Phycisphaerales bacterium]